MESNKSHVKLNNDHLIRSSLRRLRRTWRLLKWLGQAVLPDLKSSPKKDRVLLVYDLASQPFSVGDILVFQEAALVIRKIKNLGKIDVAIVYDANKPVVDDPAFLNITPEDFLYHLPPILSTIQVNPHLGATFLFDSHRSFEEYVADNESKYHIWPTVDLYSSRDYLFYHCLNDLFFEYFNRHGQLPSLKSRPAASIWAEQFLTKNAPDQIVGTVQLRRNPVNPGRNSKYEAWQEFFRYCQPRYPVKFVVICAPHEIDPKLREFPNILIAKDSYTSLEQDLALIEAAAFHMGASSGPSTICQFNRKPYCIFGWKIDPDRFRCMEHEGHRHRFYFSGKFQNWITQEESAELLKAEFQFMWKEILATAPAAPNPNPSISLRKN